MKVAVLYSGGKDSNYAVDYALSKGWKIQYLLSVKPTRKDCYLFHFATVEHTPLQAKQLGLNHFLISCDIADPDQEAALVKEFVQEKQKEFPVDALLLGGTGLQMTQLKSVQTALRVLNVEVFAAHAGLDHEEVFKEMIETEEALSAKDSVAQFFANRSGNIPMTVYLHVTRESELDFRMLYSEWIAFGLIHGHELADIGTFKMLASSLLSLHIKNDTQ